MKRCIKHLDVTRHHSSAVIWTIFKSLFSDQHGHQWIWVIMNIWKYLAVLGTEPRLPQTVESIFWLKCTQSSEEQKQVRGWGIKALELGSLSICWKLQLLLVFFYLLALNPNQGCKDFQWLFLKDFLTQMRHLRGKTMNSGSSMNYGHQSWNS